MSMDETRLHLPKAQAHCMQSRLQTSIDECASGSLALAERNRWSPVHQVMNDELTIERMNIPASDSTLKLLAISGSTRRDSTNSALLRALAAQAPDGIRLSVYTGIQTLPIFSPDAEGDSTPAPVLDFCSQVAWADGLIISSPEYVRAIPGGLKNAIDWLVSREEIIHKPVALAHASHRGEDMLASLRLVLGTVTTRFTADIFLRQALVSQSREDIDERLGGQDAVCEIRDYLEKLRLYIRSPSH